MSIGSTGHAAAVLERAPAPTAGAAVTDWGDRASSSSRVRQIDALRVLSCFSVITVHAVGAPFAIDSVGLGQVSFLLHYSREIFFFVSALVLVRTYYPRLGPDGRLPDEAAFRRRRLRLIGIPYLWWTTIYFAVSIYHTRDQPFGAMLDDLPLRWLYLVVTGNGSYHMYFLLVTLQFGVAFPLVLRLLRRTRGHHGWVLAGSAVLQVATLAVYHWVFLPDNGWRGLLGDASLIAYQLWMVGGAIVGLHLERWHAWVMRYRVLVIGALPMMAVVLMWSFWAQLPTRGALGASSPLQPIMVLWSISAVGALYLFAVLIMYRGSDGVRSAFGYLAQLSFGVYLAHPLVLDVVLSVSRRFDLFAPTVWMSLAALVLTTVGSVILCAMLHRTRLSLPLMGRGRIAPELAPRLRLPRPTGAPALFVALSVGASLLIGADQSPPTESGTPNWEQTVQASDPVFPEDTTPDTSTDTAAAGAEDQANPEAAAAPGR